MEIEGKVAIITGAAAGIGLEITKELLRNNIHGVVLVDINQNAGETVLNELSKEFKKERMIFVKADVTKDELEGAFTKAISVFGKLDIVINNAGIANEVNYELEININLIAVVRGTVLAMKYLSKENGGNGGVVLSTASVLGLIKHEALPVYAATKAGVITLMRGFGNELHYKPTGIRMLALCPGLTETGILKKTEMYGDPEIVKKLIRSCGYQMPNVVGRAAVYALKHGESSSVYEINNNQLSKIKTVEIELLEETVVQDLSI